MGRFKPVFDAAFEAGLVMRCVEMQQRSYGFTISDLKTIAFALAERNRIAHQICHVNEMAEKIGCSRLRQLHV